MAWHIVCLDDAIGALSTHLRQLETELGAVVHPTDTLQGAQVLLEEYSIDLFILDIEITGERTTGIQLAQAIRHIPRYTRTPILFISMYSHYSRHLLSSIPHCAFIAKPFSPSVLVEKAGILLGLTPYVERSYKQAILVVTTRQGSVVELDARRISYLELVRNELIVQYSDGERLRFHAAHGCLKNILLQLAEKEITYLRQVYRSVVINVEQIKRLDLQKNSGDVWLFGDETAKPVGVRYRANLAEFL